MKRPYGLGDTKGGPVIRKLVPFGTLTAVIGLLAVACGGGAAPPAAPSQPASPPPPPPAPAAPVTAPAPAAPGPAPAPSGGAVVEVRMQDEAGSGAYGFDPSEFNFKVGDTVTFMFTAETEFHTFTVDDLGIDEAVDPGPAASLTFTFDQTGTFPLICIPHELQGMTGTITVQ